MRKSLFCALLLVCFSCFAKLPADKIAAIKDAWAVAKYKQTDLEQDASFKALIKNTRLQLDKNPDDAILWTWYGTILSSYASIKGGVGALQTLVDAKEALEKAILLDTTAEEGLAHAVLGSLYYRVPAWPVSFKDKKRAEYHLAKALEISPNSVDAHYYTGDFYRRTGKPKKAMDHLTRAKQGSQHPTRSLAQSGRLQEIEESLSQIHAS